MFCGVVSGGAGDDAQVVQAAGGEHHLVHKAVAPVAPEVRDEVATLEAAAGVFDGDPAPC